jgi:hypothetical protein
MLTICIFPNCWLNTGFESDLFEVKATADGHFNYSLLCICCWQPYYYYYYYYYYYLRKTTQGSRKKYIQNHYKSPNTFIEKGHKGHQW